jgi:hypothetical protein
MCQNCYSDNNIIPRFSYPCLSVEICALNFSRAIVLNAMGIECDCTYDIICTDLRVSHSSCFCATAFISELLLA